MEHYRFFFFFCTSLNISFNTCLSILWTWDSPAHPKLSLLEAFICLISRSIIMDLNGSIIMSTTENFNLQIYSIFLSNMEETHILVWPLFLNCITKSNPWSFLQCYWDIYMHLDLVSKTPKCRYSKCSLKCQALWGCLINSFAPNSQPYCCHSWWLSTSLLERRWLYNCPYL